MSTSIAFDIIARDRASASFDKVGNSAHRSSGKLKAFAKIGVVAVGAAAVVAGKALVGMAKNALEDQAAQRRLAVALRNTVGATDAQTSAVEKWISKQGVALGVTDDELRPAFQRLVQATGDIGKAQKLAGIAMDASAGSGKSLKVVTEAIAKAQNGNLGSLSRLGIKIKDAKGETLTFNEAMKGMSKTFKGQASEAANTAAGKFDRLKLVMDETKESIGAKLIPIASKLAGFLLNDVMPAASKLGKELSDKLGPTFSKIGDFIADKLAPALKDLAGKWLEGVRGMFKNVGKSMEENKPFIDQIVKGLKALGEIIVSKVMPALGKIYEKGFPAIGKGIGLMITGLRKFATAWLFMAEYGIKGFTLLLKAAFATFGGILKAAEMGMGWIPGIGGKIKKAKAAFDDFSDKTVAALEKTSAALHRTRDAINGIKSPKPVKVDVEARQALFKLAGVSNKLAKLPTSKYITLYVDSVYKSKGKYDPTIGGLIPGKAVGGYAPGRPTMLHEQGPEIVDLPRGGTRVYPAGRSAQMVRDAAASGLSKADIEDAFYRALCRMPVFRLPDAGRGAYQQGAAY